MANIFGFTRELFKLWFPATGALLGYYYDECERERVTSFRDKSQLYGGNVGPNDPPSWGSRWSWAKYD